MSVCDGLPTQRYACITGVVDESILNRYLPANV